jgi:hypothetical protein
LSRPLGPPSSRSPIRSEDVPSSDARAIDVLGWCAFLALLVFVILPHSSLARLIQDSAPTVPRPVVVGALVVSFVGRPIVVLVTSHRGAADAEFRRRRRLGRHPVSQRVGPHPAQ